MLVKRFCENLEIFFPTWYIESVMVVVHGFRQLSVHRCKSTDQPVLIGAMGGHLHQPLSNYAGCEGASWALWMSDEVQKKTEKKQTHIEPAPAQDCTDGFYIHRTYQGAHVDPSSFWYGAMMLSGYFLQLPLITHVTAIGECVIHTEGARVQRYMIDYFVRPTGVAEPPYGTPEALSYTSPGYPRDCEEKPVDIEGSLYDLLEEKPAEQVEILLTYFSELLNRPILDPSSLEGCPHCLLASELRDPKEVTEFMIRDWDRRELVLDD